MKNCTLIAALLVITASAHGLAAQSLGVLARLEAERRKQVTPGKQYTNADLREVPPPSSPSPQPEPSTPTSPLSAVAPAPAVAASTSAPTPAGDTTAAPRGREKRDEAFWRTRSRQLRDRLEQARGQVAALEGRVGNLDAQLQAGAGPSVGRERGVASTALDRVRKDLEFLSEEVLRLEKAASIDNVPDGWIR